MKDKTIEAAVGKAYAGADELGLSSLEKFDAKESPRGVTNEQSQQPAATVTETVKTANGKFTMK